MNTRALLAISALEIPPPALVEQFIRSEETTGTGYVQKPHVDPLKIPVVPRIATASSDTCFTIKIGPRVCLPKSKIRQYRKRQRQARRKGRG